MKIRDYIFIAGLVIFVFWFFKPLKGNEAVHTIEHHYIDTVDNYKIIQPKIVIPKPQIVYLDTGSLKIIHDTIKGVPVNKYQDSIIDTNYKFYYSALVDGELIDLDVKHTSFERVITDVKRITNTKMYNSIYLSTEFGGNGTRFNNMSIGGTYSNKKGYSANYRYNFIEKTHNIGVGKRLFKW